MEFIRNNIMKGSTVKFVFVTHPHEDHFKLLISADFILVFQEHFRGCSFYLGGEEKFWFSQSSSCFLKAIRDPCLRCPLAFLGTKGYEFKFESMGITTKVFRMRHLKINLTFLQKIIG